MTSHITELSETASHKKLGKLENIKQKEDDKMTKQFGQEKAFYQVTSLSLHYYNIDVLLFLYYCLLSML